MARQAVPVEINKFNAGLNTDASPLTAPDNTCSELENMVLNFDGSLQRRLGMNVEAEHEIITTTIPNANTTNIAVTTYLWKNAGGDPEQNISVVQIGDRLDFFVLEDGEAVSANITYSFTVPVGNNTTAFSYSVVDGILIVASGVKTPYSFTFEAPNIFTPTPITLYIRDLFGVEDIVDGVDLYSGEGLQTRPSTSTDAHIYNLRNQGWGIPRLDGNNEGLEDPIDAFLGESGNTYPSNSDTLTAALYADPEDTDNRTIERFFAENLYKNPLGSTKSAQGYYIIDALERGSSRLQNNASNQTLYPDLNHPLATLPQDTTPGGPTVVGEFAGRIWYGGFSGQIIDGDNLSPRLSSYVLFTKLVNNPTDVNKCYQEGDPTSKFNADIVDTDGGFIRLNEAYGVKSLTNLLASLVVGASNGFWRIVGGTDNGFTATNYIVEKISSNGASSRDSIVVADNSIFYWGEDAIYQLGLNEQGGWGSKNISTGNIQKLFDGIDKANRANVKGHYDGFERKIRWIYYNLTSEGAETRELVLDLNLSAFYVNVIKNVPGFTAKVVSPYLGLPYQIPSSDPTSVFRREVGYVALTQLTPTVSYTFSLYRDEDFRDWAFTNGQGVDAEAFFVTTHLSGTDFLREKQIPFLVAHLRRTETAFEMEGSEIVPTNRSSCLIQSRWDWADSNNSNKWSRPFQAYRYRRHWIPEDVNSEFDYGFETIRSRNKIRGTGKVVSFKFFTEPERDLHLYGWSMIFQVQGTI
jgi:hypothetical protein